MKEIDEDEYLKVLKKLASEKFESLSDKNILIKKNKTAKYIASRGFEVELVWDLLNKSSF